MALKRLSQALNLVTKWSRPRFICLRTGLPDGLFSNQKSKFG
jgi:hypothetical protein